MLELSIGLSVAAVCGSGVVVARWYFSDKAAQRKESAIEREGLPIAVLSLVDGIEKRVRAIEAQGLNKLR